MSGSRNMALPDVPGLDMKLLNTSQWGNTPQPASPADGLPVELLMKIFLIGHANDIQQAWPTFESYLDFEVSVSHVCTRWREISLRTSALWTRLRFRLLSDLIRARIYVERSRQQLLDITVDTATEDAHVPGITLFKDEFDPVFDIIVPHVDRWRSFVLKVRDHECKAGARSRLATCGPAPNLATLQLYHFQDWGTGQNLFLSTSKPPVLIFNAVLPRLVNVSFIGVNLTWDSCPFLSNLKSLELALHIEGVRPTYKQWERILRASPELEKLSLHYSGPQVHTVWTSEPIVLERLQDLALTFLDSEYLIKLLRRLRMANLRTLHLDLAEDDQTTFVEYISDPAAPLFTSLQSLYVAALECDPSLWRKFLVSVPQITMLEVNFGRVKEGFFQELFKFVEYETLPTTADNVDTEDDPDKTVHTTITTPTTPANQTTSTIATTSTTTSAVTSTTTSTAPSTTISTTTSRPRILLPNLTCLKTTGLTGQDLTRFITFRKNAGRPVPQFLVWRKDRDLETEALRETENLEYFRFDMDVFGHVDEDTESEDEEGEEGEGEEDDF